jgi:hypothetical protein
VVSSVAYSQTEKKCEQVFHFFDKTAGEYCLMFYRAHWDGDGDGGCGRGIFFTLFLLPDRVHSFQSTSLYGNWVDDLYENFPIEQYELLEDSNGAYYLNDSAYFTAPPLDSVFDSLYNNLPKHNAKTYYWEYPHNSSDIDFCGFTPELIWRHPGGLYLGYQIREARYYRESNYLIVLTDQPRLDRNGRTMNGFLIYKVDGWKWLGKPPQSFKPQKCK